MSDLTNKVLKSSSLLLFAKTLQRATGLLSVLILARLLGPKDFGIVAISALIIHFSDALSASGSEAYLIQKKTVDNVDLSTSWTIDILLKGTVCILLILAAPLVVDFYHDSRLLDLLRVASTVLLLNALKNPGMTVLKRELQYRKIFYVLISQKLISFGFTVTVAYFTHSYWALVIGDLVSSAVMLVGSYIVHPFRPILSLNRYKDQWIFTKWVLFRAGVGYAKSEMDSLFVSKFFSPLELGAFYVTKNLSVLPSRDIITPAVEPLLAPLARVQQEPKIFSSHLSKSLFLIISLTVPICVFMYFFPNEIINFFFGLKWTAAYPILPPLAIVLGTIAVGQVINQAFVALGKVRSLFYFEVVGILLLGVTLFLSRDDGIARFTYFRALMAVILVLGTLLYVRFISPISLRRLLVLSLPSIILAVANAVFVKLLIGDVKIFGPTFEVYPLGALFVAFYFFGFFLLLKVLYARFDEGIFFFSLMDGLRDKLMKKLFKRKY